MPLFFTCICSFLCPTAFVFMTGCRAAKSGVMRFVRVLRRDNKESFVGRLFYIYNNSVDVHVIMVIISPEMVDARDELKSSVLSIRGGYFGVKCVLERAKQSLFATFEVCLKGGKKVSSFSRSKKWSMKSSTYEWQNAAGTHIAGDTSRDRNREI